MIKHKMTVATLALSLFLIGTTTVLVSCSNNQETKIEQPNAKQLGAFEKALKSLNNPEYYPKTVNVSEEQIVFFEKKRELVLLDVAKNLNVAFNTDEQLMSKQDNQTIIAKALAIYSENNNKSQKN